jgi:hypothetical protein
MPFSLNSLEFSRHRPLEHHRQSLVQEFTAAIWHLSQGLDFPALGPHQFTF